MAYLQIGEVPSREFLQDIASREEFATQARHDADTKESFWPMDGEMKKTFRLHGGQSFARNYHNPDTPYSRLLLIWPPGTGKTIAALSVGKKYVNEFRNRKNTLPEHRPSVFVIGFTKAVIQSEMLRNPELGFVTQAEVIERQHLYNIAQRSGSTTSPESRRYAGYVGMLQRRFVNRPRGGYFQFYGYKEFALRLFVLTAKGTKEDFNVGNMFTASKTREEFVESMSHAEQEGLVRVNSDLIASMRQGLIIADEIHVVYNMRERNMYGIALQYALDSLPPAEAPRALFMSATPMTGSSTEIIDLLNLLVPRECLPANKPLHVNDLFSSLTPPKLRPEALKTIRELTVGRICVATMSDTSEYPEVLWAGERDPDIPYIKIIKCIYSPEHLEALKAGNGRPYNQDFAFPNPDKPPSFTLDQDTIIGAAANWKQKQGIQIVGSGRDTQISGPFLAAQLKKCSTKYYQFVKDLLAYIRKGDSGKILAFHMYVHGAGANLIAQILIHNGFILEGTSSTAQTICSVCGVVRSKHGAGKGHTYRPAVVAVVTSEMSNSSLDQTRNRFNSAQNINGEKIKVLLGSRVILQSLNFLAVRVQVTLAIPYDINSLVQLLGRSDRRGGHSMLPADKQNVTYWIYVFEDPSGSYPDELSTYRRKSQEFEPIQQIGRAMVETAVNAFATVFPKESSLNSLAIKPEVGKPLPTKSRATYFAYGAVHDRIQVISQMIKKAMSHSPVWTYDDLQEWLMKSGVLDHGERYLFSMSLSLLSRKSNKTVMIKEGVKYRLVSPQVKRNNQGRRIVPVGQYIVAAPIDPDNRPRVYTECYLRQLATNTRHQLNLRHYVEQSRASGIFASQVASFISTAANAKFLVELDSSFHYSLMKTIVVGKATGNIKKACDMAKPIYQAFRMLVTRKQVGSGSGADIVGYVGPQDVHVLAPNGKWLTIGKSEAGIESRHKENNIIVGYTEEKHREVRFKLREPAQKIVAAPIRDSRSLAKGAVCATRPKEEQLSILDKLKVKLQPKQNRCDAIQSALLQKERDSRQTNGLRWFYLFNDSMPDLKV